MKYLLLPLLFCSLLVSGCAPSQSVSRVAADTQTDLSGRWNDTDARLVAEEMISDALSQPWLSNYKQDNSNQPVTIVGRVRNETMEHIDTEVITKEMERAFINSGQLIGNINSIVDESLSGKDAAIFYKVNLELIDVETNRKVWIGNKEIKKLIERRKLRG